MIPTQDTYPVFEANQVLTNRHLNQVFNYLDEQDRLTRANLIGIGIVCGLELRFQATQPTIEITKGCGVTSQGYLIIEHEDVTLTSYKQGYKVPSRVAYPTFFDSTNTPYPLWELFPDGEPNATALSSPANFLNDKVVLLFLELKEDDLRNCSPNNCDDKGTEVVGIVRRLLIRSGDLDEIIATANNLDTGITALDLDDILSSRLNLPDIRIPRFNVPNTNPVSSNDIFSAYLDLFRKENLVTRTHQALTEAYHAFLPVVEETYPSDPFQGFLQKFSFLQSTPSSIDHITFLQYYYDFFDDLLKAYDEFRWKGAELICACCPDERLFPRHLMLGAVHPQNMIRPAIYRHHFLPSGALDRCDEHTLDMIQLFKRLVEMFRQFTHKPVLPAVSTNTKTDGQIRITPSKLADVPVSDKAIPYYYSFGATPSIHSLWNVEKKRRKRANQNLGYYSDTYQPSAPPFVINPLKYDLEPYNFLRIEGHLKKNFRSVLATLLELKKKYRLPIEIIALRTGVFDEKIAVDLKREDCHFQDLDTLFDALRDELLCSIRKAVSNLSDKKIDRPIAIPDLTLRVLPVKPVFIRILPEYTFKADTVGALLFDRLKENNFGGLHDFAENPLINAVATTAGTLVQLAELLESNLFDIDWDKFDILYKRLKKSSQDIGKLIAADESVGELSWKELQNQLMAVIFACRLDAFKSIKEEYARRVRELKQKQFLSFFTKHNPGLQHKAGVPMGGTFILVYHEDPLPVVTFPGRRPFPDILATDISLGSFSAIDTVPLKSPISNESLESISDTFNRIKLKRELLQDRDIQDLFANFTGLIPNLDFFPDKATLDDDTDKKIAEAVNSYPNGTVIADFYLPYICCSDCSPIQYILPAEAFQFEVLKACTTNKREAEVTIKPLGGTPPITFQANGGEFKPLEGAVVLPVGQHTIILRDSNGAQSAPQAIEIPEPLTIIEEVIKPNPVNGTFKVAFGIRGGTAPFSTDMGDIQDRKFESKDIASTTKQTITIKDSVGCSVQKEFGPIEAGPCNLPCEGIANHCGYRFWIPVPEPQFNRPYKSYDAKAKRFVITLPDGSTVDLAREVTDIIQADAAELNADFNAVVGRWMKKINDLILQKSGSPETMILSYADRPRESFGTLEIEYFRCHRFEIQLNIKIIRPEIAESYSVQYLPDQTKIETQGTPAITIPAFNCLLINKCVNPRETKITCKELDMNIEIREELRGLKLTLRMKTGGTDIPQSVLWEVQDATPAFSNDKEATFNFTSDRSGFRIIRLTAFTADGCMRVFEKTIQFGR